VEGGVGTARCGTLGVGVLVTLRGREAWGREALLHGGAPSGRAERPRAAPSGREGTIEPASAVSPRDSKGIAHSRGSTSRGVTTTMRPTPGTRPRVSTLATTHAWLRSSLPSSAAPPPGSAAIRPRARARTHAHTRTRTRTRMHTLARVCSDVSLFALRVLLTDVVVILRVWTPEPHPTPTPTPTQDPDPNRTPNWFGLGVVPL
jgi:hypothetical protein